MLPLGVDHVVKLHHADELASHIVDSHAVEVLAFEGDHRSGGVRIDAGQLGDSLFNAIGDIQNHRDNSLRQVSIVGVDDEISTVGRAHAEANGVDAEGDGLALTAHDGTFGLVDGGPSGGNKFTFAVDGDQPSTTEAASAVAVAEAVATGAEPVTILLFTIFATVHAHRIFTSILFERNSSPHGLTRHVNRLIEGSSNPSTSSSGVDGLFGKEFTGLVVEALTIDTEGVVVVGSLILCTNEVLSRNDSHTHSSTSISGSRQTDTHLTAVSSIGTNALAFFTIVVVEVGGL